MFNRYLRNMSLLVFMSLALCSMPSTADSSSEELTKGILNFGLNLAKNSYLKAGAEDNVLLTPSTVYLTLSTLALGADGSSRDELTAALGFPKNNVTGAFNEANEILSRIKYTVLNSYIPGFTGRYVYVSIGFSSILFPGKDVELKPAFSDLQRSSYYNRISLNVDFSNQSATAEVVKEEVIGDGHVFPGGLLPELNSLVSSSARALLINYFDAIIQWDEAFPKNQTKVEKFDLGSKQIDVQMMHNKGKVQFYKNPNLKFSAVGIPVIAGSTYLAYIILPDADQTVKNLVEQITADELRLVVNNSTKVEMDYKLPRLNLKSSQSINGALKDSLPSLFQNPNLNNMITNPKPVEVLLHHATEFTTYEDGSTMKGTTTAGLYEKIPQSLSGAASTSSQNSFVVNKPFLVYVIYSRFDDYPIIAFNAIVQNPAK